MTKDEQIATLARLGVDVVAQGTCQPPDLHEQAGRRPGAGSWPWSSQPDPVLHVRSDEPRADWVSWLDVEKLGGYVELWLEGLTPNRTYLFDVADRLVAQQ